MNRSNSIDRALPKNLMVSGSAEQKALGAILLSKDEDQITQAFSRLSEAHFCNATNATLFRVLGNMHKSGQPIVIDYVFPLFCEQAEMSGDDAADYLNAAYESAMTQYLPNYVGSVLRCWQQRELIYGLRDCDEKLATASIGVDEAVTQLRDKLDEVSVGVDAESIDDSHVAKILAEMMSNPQLSEEAFPFGIAELDKTLNGGLRRGQLVVIGARPSVGKSLLSGQVALKTAQRGNGALYLSYEMQGVEMMARWMKQAGWKTDDSTDIGRMGELKLWSPACGDWTIALVEAETRQAVKKHGVDLLVVDYLGLIPQISNRDDRIRHLSDCTRRLKSLAQSAKIAVLLVAQFNRNTESREDKRPRMSDFRECGSIEQDADVLLGLSRDLTPGNSQDATCYVMKQRAGQTADIRLMLHSDYAKFVEPADDRFEAPGW